jgi:cytoskeleton protein RodZ
MSESATTVQLDDPQSPGRQLAAARQARGMTVTEVALRLKFAPRQIEALEADRYDVLRGPAMVRGMIRAYAKLLGADAGPLLDALQHRLNAGPVTMQPRAMAVPLPRATPKGSLAYVILSAIVVIAVVSVVVEWVLRPGSPPGTASTARPAPAAKPVAEPVRPREAVPPPPPIADPPAAVGSTPGPVVSPGPTGSPAPAAASARAAAPAAEAQRGTPIRHETVLNAKRIELVFDRESWVEIRDADGRIVFSQLNPPGSRRNVVGEAPFSIVIGNATGVKLRYNNADVDLAPFTRTDVARLTLQ